MQCVITVVTSAKRAAEKTISRNEESSSNRAVGS